MRVRRKIEIFEAGEKNPGGEKDLLKTIREGSPPLELQLRRFFCRIQSLENCVLTSDEVDSEKFFF